MSSGSNNTIIIGLLKLAMPLSETDFRFLSSDNSTAMEFFHLAVFHDADSTITTFDDVPIGHVGEDEIRIHGELFDGADIYAFQDILNYLTEKGYEPKGKIGFSESLGLIQIYQVNNANSQIIASKLYGSKSLIEMDPDMDAIDKKIEKSLREQIVSYEQEQEER